MLKIPIILTLLFKDRQLPLKLLLCSQPRHHLGHQDNVGHSGSHFILQHIIPVPKSCRSQPQTNYGCSRIYDVDAGKWNISWDQRFESIYERCGQFPVSVLGFPFILSVLNEVNVDE